MSNLLEAVSKDLATKSHIEQIDAIGQAAQSLPDDQKRAFAHAFGVNIPLPEQTTSNRVWIIIITSFVLVMVISVIALCVSVFVPPVKDATKPEIILTVFMTATSFLAGLFAQNTMASKTKS